MPENEYLISQILLPDGNTYDIKDAYARDMIKDLLAGALSFIKCTAAGNTPKGVQWDDSGTTITGTLDPTADTKGKIYLVPQKNGTGKDIFEEYVTINTGTDASPVYA